MRAYSAWLMVLAALCSCKSHNDNKPAGNMPDSGTSSDAGPAVIHKLDRSGFADVSLSGRLDYSTPEYWVCRPDIDPDECASDLDATEVKPDGSLEVVKHEPAADPKFDCFYVYPTVWVNQTAQMNDFSATGVSLVLDPLLAQAARFTRMCRVFAPMYRQVGLSGTGITPGADKQLALQDVRDAFNYFLEHDSKGRKFVLLGHSQGAVMLTSLIRLDIDNNPALRERMISAVLLGAQPYAPAGQTVGGSFQNVVACTSPGQTGCVIAYNSFAKESPPTDQALVGHVTTVFPNEDVDTSGIVFCTEPAMLANNSGRYQGSYFPLMVMNTMFGMPTPVPGANTPFALYRNLLQGHCVQNGTLNYLEVSAVQDSGDTRPLPDYRNPVLESVGFGMHLVDYNIALDDLLAAVQLQADAAL